MTVDVGAPLEHIERALVSAAEAREEGDGAPEERVAAHPEAWLKPTTVAVMERLGRPFHIRDLSASAPKEGLRVRTWVRTKGLRLAPITFSWDQVDNPEGAKAFVREVKARQRSTSRPGTFSGVMDYWLSWLLLGTGLLVLLWPKGRGEAEDEEEVQEAAEVEEG
jgi:hypothetical protein